MSEHGGQFENVRMEIHVGDAYAGHHIKTNIPSVRLSKLTSSHRETVDYTTVRKWKRRFMNGCERKSPICQSRGIFKLVRRREKCVNVLRGYDET